MFHPQNMLYTFDIGAEVKYNISMLQYTYKLERRAAKGNRSPRESLAQSARAEHANAQFEFNRTRTQAVVLMQPAQVDGAGLRRVRS